MPFGGGQTYRQQCLIRVPFSRALGALITEMAIWDSPAWSYGWKRPGEVQDRSWNVFQSAASSHPKHPPHWDSCGGFPAGNRPFVS